MFQNVTMRSRILWIRQTTVKQFLNVAKHIYIYSFTSPLLNHLLILLFKLHSYDVFSQNLSLKGVFAKNERGYRLNAIKKRF